VYESLYGGADESPAGRQAVRLSTKAQALALGKNLAKANAALTYSLYKFGSEGDMNLLGSFPKRVNAEGARVRFRRRRPRLGGADDALLGVGGMGDDVWRELLQRDALGEIDAVWSSFRKELELGRGLDVVDERGMRWCDAVWVFEADCSECERAGRDDDVVAELRCACCVA
jgi:hypothetical protein